MVWKVLFKFTKLTELISIWLVFHWLEDLQLKDHFHICSSWSVLRHKICYYVMKEVKVHINLSMAGIPKHRYLKERQERHWTETRIVETADKDSLKWKVKMKIESQKSQRPHIAQLQKPVKRGIKYVAKMVYQSREMRVGPEETMKWLEQKASHEQYVVFFLVFNLKKLKINSSIKVCKY